LYKIPASTLFLGKSLVFMPECHSTNTFALELCQQSPLPADGTVVITSNQIAGRGQRGNTWLVEPGRNLTFSIILRTHFLAIKDQFYLNIFISLAVYDYLKHKQCPYPAIKWPNDIYTVNKKICGVLVENQILGNNLTNTVVGVGLNINQDHFEMNQATSLRLVTNSEFRLDEELDLLLGIIEARYLLLRQHHFTVLMKDYLDAMYWLNEVHTFQSNSIEFQGTITGVDPSGKLKIMTSGKENVFDLKQISYVS
jgi:BirA family transcriptional regulator, biotin operon repressor / biotin---[acetyl-CoA-carboxylase] ligase